MTKTETTGSYIQKRRTSLKLTQNTISKAMGWKSPQFVGNIERNLASLPPHSVVKIAKLLKTYPEILVKLQVNTYAKDYIASVYGTKTTKKKTVKK